MFNVQTINVRCVGSSVFWCSFQDYIPHTLHAFFVVYVLYTHSSKHIKMDHKAPYIRRYILHTHARHTPAPSLQMSLCNNTTVNQYTAIHGLLFFTCFSRLNDCCCSVTDLLLGFSQKNYLDLYMINSFLVLFQSSAMSQQQFSKMEKLPRLNMSSLVHQEY